MRRNLFRAIVVAVLIFRSFGLLPDVVRAQTPTDLAEAPWGDDDWEDVGPRDANPDLRDTDEPEDGGDPEPATDTPAEESPAEAPPADEDAPADEDSPDEDSPDEEAPTEDAVPEETPTEDAPTEDAPADEDAPTDEVEPDEAPPDDPAGDEAVLEHGEDDEEDARVAEWRAALLYGIDDLVIEALSGMIAAEQDGLGEETAAILEETRNDEVRTKAFEYLRTVGDASGAEIALEILQQDLDGEVVREAVRYLRDVEPDDPEQAERRAPAMFELITTRSIRTAQVAVRAIGEFGDTDEARGLAELFNELPSGSQQLQGEILLALGDIGSEEAVPFLVQILEDPIYGSVLRRYAADGLGRTGDERGLPALRSAAESDDTALKAYAIGGLARFRDDESVDTLRRAIRDSNPLVRRFAIEGLGRNEVEDAVPALIFQVRRDPDMQVRTAAVGALSKIGNDEAISFLQEQYRSARTPVELRNRIANALVADHLEDATGVLLEVMEEEWSTSNSRVLDHLARRLSETEHDAASEFYERLLEHPNFVMQIYAVRGIGLNELSRFRDELERRAEDDSHPALKRSAQAALEQLGA